MEFPTKGTNEEAQMETDQDANSEKAEYVMKG
jgi:hypothetical protein